MDDNGKITMFNDERQEVYLAALLMDKDRRFDQLKEDSQRNFDEFARANETRGRREWFGSWLANVVNFAQLILLIVLIHKFG